MPIGEQARPLRKADSHPEAPDKKSFREQEPAAMEVGDLAVVSGPPPWWKEAMQIERKENAKMTEAAVEKAMLKVNAELADLRVEVGDVRTQAQLAAVAASEAKEQLPVMKV